MLRRATDFQLFREEDLQIPFFTSSRTELAVMVLKETRHRINAMAFTNGGIAPAQPHPSFKRTMANIPCSFASSTSTVLAARTLSGYSHLVLCE